MKSLKIKSLVSALVLTAALIAAVTITFAQDRPGNNSSAEESCGAQCHLRCYGAELNLSDTQKTQMQERINRFRETTAGLREQLATLRQQSRAAEDGGTINEASVRAAAQTRANLQVEMEVAHARLISELNALLTPEQRAKRAEQKRQCAERRSELRSRRGNNSNRSF